MDEVPRKREVAPVGPEVAGSAGSVGGPVPAAVRVPPKIEDGRYVEIVPTHVGMAGIFGDIHAADGAALDQRLDALAATVCDNDPRTSEQRRADACGPLARGEATLACQCGSDDCPATAERNAAAAAIIHVSPSRPPSTGP